MKETQMKRKGNIIKYSDEEYYLPKDTKDTLIDKNRIDTNRIDNFNLLLNKTAFFDGKKFLFYKRDEQNEIIITNKYNALKTQYDNFIRHLSKSYENAVTQLVSKDNLASDIFSPDWRVIIGLGNESVYEISITLHHIYGIPYIPGQAIKGVTRSFIINECFNQKEDAALKDKLFCCIFGSAENSVLKEYQGRVIFFDAYPVNFPSLEVDIMNPHYGDYYQGKEIPPADYLNPNPIPFLTVGKTSEFRFFVGMKQLKTAKDVLNGQKSAILDRISLKEESFLYEIAFRWLKKALIDFGIGAKTAIGYGHFQKKRR